MTPVHAVRVRLGVVELSVDRSTLVVLGALDRRQLAIFVATLFGARNAFLTRSHELDLVRDAHLKELRVQVTLDDDLLSRAVHDLEFVVLVAGLHIQLLQDVALLVERA